MRLFSLLTCLLIGNALADEKPAPPPPIDPEDPEILREVVFQISHEDEIFGDLRIGLFSDVAPKTAENFYVLAKLKEYEDTELNQVTPGFIIRGGNLDEFGSYSILGYGTCVSEDEKYVVSHDRKGRLAMADGAMSQFFFVLTDVHSIDSLAVVFGQVIDGFDVLDKIQQVERDKKDAPLDPVLIKKVTTYQQGKLDEKFTKEEMSYPLVQQRLAERAQGEQSAKPLTIKKPEQAENAEKLGETELLEKVEQAKKEEVLQNPPRLRPIRLHRPQSTLTAVTISVVLTAIILMLFHSRRKILVYLRGKVHSRVH